MTVPILTGAATMDPDVLVDSLVADVIDGLREDLHPQFGVRAYRLYRVIRTWSGRETGEGRAVDVVTELRPQPRVKMWDGFRYVQMTCGINDIGGVRLSEISLTYTAAQLDPQDLAKNQEIFFALGEAHGQESPLRLWTHAQPPFIDRERDMGWVLNLDKIDSPSTVVLP